MNRGPDLKNCLNKETNSKLCISIVSKCPCTPLNPVWHLFINIRTKEILRLETQKESQFIVPHILPYLLSLSQSLTHIK